MSQWKLYCCAVLLIAALLAGCAHQDADYTMHAGARSRAEASAIRVAMQAYGLSQAVAEGYEISVQSEAGSWNVMVLIAPHYELPAGMKMQGDPSGRAIAFTISPTGQVLERVYQR